MSDPVLTPPVVPVCPHPRDLGGPHRTRHLEQPSPCGMSPQPVPCPCLHPAPGTLTAVLLLLSSCLSGSQCLHPVPGAPVHSPIPTVPTCSLCPCACPAPAQDPLSHPALVSLSPPTPVPVLLLNVPIPTLLLLSPFPSCSHSPHHPFCSQCLHNFPIPNVPIPLQCPLLGLIAPILPWCSSCFCCSHHCPAPCVPDLILLAVSLSCFRFPHPILLLSLHCSQRPWFPPCS